VLWRRVEVHQLAVDRYTGAVERYGVCSVAERTVIEDATVVEVATEELRRQLLGISISGPQVFFEETPPVFTVPPVVSGTLLITWSTTGTM